MDKPDVVIVREWPWFHESIIGIKNWKWLALLGAILGGLIIGRIVRFIAEKFIKKWLKLREAKGRPPIPEEVYDNIEHPFGYFIATILFLFTFPLLNIVNRPGEILHNIAIAVATMTGIWATFKVLDLIGELVMQVASKTESKLDDILVPLVRRTLKIFMVFGGVLFLAQKFGEDVTSIMAGLGLGGLAFALAAKDTVENLFGSVTILSDQPFRIGDWVVIDGAEGTVEEVGLRSTRIRTFYNSQITIPNGKLVNACVDNLGLREFRRSNSMLSLTYDTAPETIEAFCEGVREIIRLHPYTRKDYFNVFFNAFAASSLDVMLYVFWKVPDWPTELREKQRLFVDVLRLARKLGVEFAYPTQTLHIPNLPAQTTLEVKSEDAQVLLTGIDMDNALEIGRKAAREIVKSTLGDPVKVPAPATGC